VDPSGIAVLAAVGGDVVVGTNAYEVHRIRLSDLTTVWRVPTDAIFYDLRALSNGDLLAGTEDGRVVRWTGDGAKVWDTPVSEWVNAVSVAADGRVLAVGSEDVALLDPTTGAVVDRWASEGVQVAFGAPDGSVVISEGPRWTRRDRSGAVIGALDGGHEAIIRTGNLFGRWLASGDDGGVVCLWDVAATVPSACWPAHASTVWTVEFVDQGRLLATGGSDGVSRLWSLRDLTSDPVEVARAVARDHGLKAGDGRAGEVHR
jgi:WD40 repeat protein